MSILSINRGFAARSLFGGRASDPSVEEAPRETPPTPAVPPTTPLSPPTAPASAPATPAAAADSIAKAGVTAENRHAPRWPAALFPTVTGLRFSPHGIDAKLVNISRNGLLAECGVRLKPSAAVTIMFEGTFSPASAEGRVTRCSVAAMGRDGGLLYHVGISFERPIPLDEPSPAAAPRDVVPQAPADEPSAAAVPRDVVPQAAIGPVRNRW